MIVTIQNGGITAAVDSIGAQLISLKDSKGKEYIWQRDPKVWARCSPLLFPIVGHCRDDKTVIEGREYHLTQHGFCRDMDFAVSGRTPESAVFSVSDNQETKKRYPYSFRISLSYALAEDGTLSMNYRVENTDNRTIYYCIGAHPGFICPLEEHERFEDYVLEFEKEETADSMVYDLENRHFDPSHRRKQLENSRVLPLSYEMFKDDAVYFDKLESRKVSLLNPATGRGVEVAYPGFDTVAFWTPCEKRAPLLCVEPWNGSAVYATEDDLFIHKNHIQEAVRGEIRAYRLAIRILQRGR